MVTSERPEFETVWVFGADCGNNNTSAILKAHDLCNQYGMDIISVGNTIGMCMEMFEKGYLTEKDIGFPLKFGDPDAMVKLVELTGKREGFVTSMTEVLEHVKQSHGSMESFPQYGSAGILHIYNEVGMLATRNYQTGVFEHAADIGGEAMASKHLRKIRACFSCPQSCGGIM